MTQQTKSYLNFFRVAAKEVPAYHNFLKKNEINVQSIRSLKDFRKLPIMDKHNFVYRYPLKQLFKQKKIPAMIYASSGSSGKPTFWFRDDEQEILGGKIHLRIFRDVFNIGPKEPTLVIVCFSTGIWVAGNFTLAACRYVSRQGFNLTTVTPGIEKEDIFSCLKNLAPQFKNVILAGYPPFVMDILHESTKKGIKLGNNVKIITAGDKFSEDWRKAAMKIIGHKDPLRSIVGIYGCADAGALGFETPLSIFIRCKAVENPRLYEDLFGLDDSLPALIQYDPDQIFFEELNSELILTAKTSIPLIRYNIHDIGNLLRFEQIVAILEKHKLLNAAKSHDLMKWQLPFIVKKGRSDVAVTFYAINIYPEHLRAGIEKGQASKLLTGNFITYNKDVQHHKRQKLFIKLQLAAKVKPSKLIRKLAAKSIFNNLMKVSIEYRKLFSVIGKRALPQIVLTNTADFGSFNQTGVVNIKGKKPRVILVKKNN